MKHVIRREDLNPEVLPPMRLRVINLEQPVSHCTSRTSHQARDHLYTDIRMKKFL